MGAGVVTPALERFCVQANANAKAMLKRCTGYSRFPILNDRKAL